MKIIATVSDLRRHVEDHLGAEADDQTVDAVTEYIRAIGHPAWGSADWADFLAGIDLWAIVESCESICSVCGGVARRHYPAHTCNDCVFCSPECRDDWLLEQGIEEEHDEDDFV